MATVKDASPVRAVRLLTRTYFRHCELDGQSSDLVLNLNSGVPHNEDVILADEMERQSVWRVGDVASRKSNTRRATNTPTCHGQHPD